jgi:hypothetical protein
MKYKLEAKDMDIKELKKMVKMKQEELSEMQASLSCWLTQRECLSYGVRELGDGLLFCYKLPNISMWLLVCISLLKTSLGC